MNALATIFIVALSFGACKIDAGVDIKIKSTASPSAETSVQPPIPDSSSSEVETVQEVVVCLTSTGATRLPMQTTPGSLCERNDISFDAYHFAEHVPYCRPRVTDELKHAVLSSYGIDDKNADIFEFDHLIPLALGGSNSPDNIWPQPIGDVKEKNDFEEKLYNQMKAGTLTQKDAVEQIKTWMPHDCKQH